MLRRRSPAAVPAHLSTESVALGVLSDHPDSLRDLVERVEVIEQLVKVSGREGTIRLPMVALAIHFWPLTCDAGYSWPIQAATARTSHQLAKASISHAIVANRANLK